MTDISNRGGGFYGGKPPVPLDLYDLLISVGHFSPDLPVEAIDGNHHESVNETAG